MSVINSLFFFFNNQRRKAVWRNVFNKKIDCILFIPKAVILIGGSLGHLRRFLERLSNKNCYEFNSYFTQALREIHCASGE